MSMPDAYWLFELPNDTASPLVTATPPPVLTWELAQPSYKGNSLIGNSVNRKGISIEVEDVG